VVPSLQPPIILFTQEEINEHCALHDDEEAADMRELYSSSTSSIDEVCDILTPNASSSIPLLSQSLPESVPIFSLAPSRNHPSSPNFNPRMLPSLSFGTVSQPLPRPLVQSKHLASTRSFFTESVAIARSQSNTSLMTDLFYNNKAGIYQETPSSHPAWRMANPPHVLQPYSEAMYPGCSNRSFQNVDYLMTAMGQAIRELNSSLGIPRLTFDTIVEAAVKCDVCMCMFSSEGYNHHIVNRNCGNSHIALPVTPCEVDVDVIRALRLRTFSEPAIASTAKEFLETPVGIAYLEFNSKIGVPMDVWAMITTAYVACRTCHLTRTFPGHQAHLDLSGECHDLGEAVALLEKGKGKARAVDLIEDDNSAEPEGEVGA
ncbi:hypothetical protein CVT25_010533, partial [Psilocybe cyanescens]